MTANLFISFDWNDKKQLAWRTSGGISLLYGYGECGSIDAKEIAERGSHEIAQNAAMFYSLHGTCKLKGTEPFQWLKNLFEVLPDSKANKLEEKHLLLNECLSVELQSSLF